MRDRNDHPRGTDSATIERVMMALHLPLHKVLRARLPPRPPLPSVDRGIGEHVQINIQAAHLNFAVVGYTRAFRSHAVPKSKDTRPIWQSIKAAASLSFSP